MCADVRLGTYHERRAASPLVSPDRRRRFMDPLTGEPVLRAELPMSWHPTLISLTRAEGAPRLTLAFEAQDGAGALIRYRSPQSGLEAEDAAAYLDALVAEQAGPDATFVCDLTSPAPVPADLEARLAPARAGFSAKTVARCYATSLAGVRYRVALAACVWSKAGTARGVGAEAVRTTARTSASSVLGTGGVVADAGRRLQDALFGQHTDVGYLERRLRRGSVTAPEPEAVPVSAWGDEGLFVLAAPEDAFEGLFESVFCPFCETVSEDEHVAFLARRLQGDERPSAPAADVRAPSGAHFASQLREQVRGVADSVAASIPTRESRGAEVAAPMSTPASTPANAPVNAPASAFGQPWQPGGSDPAQADMDASAWQTSDTFGGQGSEHTGGSDWSDLLG